MLAGAVVASLIAFVCRLLLAVYFSSFSSLSTPPAAPDLSELTLLRNELVSLRHLVAAQEQSLASERTASAAAARAAYQAAAANADAADAVSPSWLGQAPTLHFSSTQGWSRDATAQLARDLRRLQEDVAGARPRTRAVDTGRARTQNAWASHQREPPATSSSDSSTSSGTGSVEVVLARVEAALGRMEDRAFDLEQAWAKLYHEKVEAMHSVQELRRVIGATSALTHSDGTRLATPGKPAAPSDTAQAGKADLDGKGRQQSGEGVLASKPSTTTASRPTQGRRKPMRKESVEDWEREWEMEDEKEKLADTAASSLASEMQRLLKMMTASIGQGVTAKERKDGKAQRETSVGGATLQRQVDAQEGPMAISSTARPGGEQSAPSSTRSSDVDGERRFGHARHPPDEYTTAPSAMGDERGSSFSDTSAHPTAVGGGEAQPKPTPIPHAQPSRIRHASNSQDDEESVLIIEEVD